MLSSKPPVVKLKGSDAQKLIFAQFDSVALEAEVVRVAVGSESYMLYCRLDVRIIQSTKWMIMPTKLQINRARGDTEFHIECGYIVVLSHKNPIATIRSQKLMK